MLDINTATLEELAALPGLGWVEACELALWRPYQSWSDLDIPALACIDMATLWNAGAVILPPNTDSWRVGAAFEVSARDGTGQAASPPA